MDTILKKKGRIAMAWVVIVTMIFATLYTPFAYAVDSTTYPSGNTFSNFQKVDKANITSTTVPADADFIFIKQASEKQGEHYLWTPVQITDDQLKKDILQYVKDNDPSMGNNPQYDAEFWANFDNFIWGYDDDVDKFNVSPYGFTKQEIEGKYYTVIEWTALSHIDFGYYEEEEVTPGSVQIQATKTFEDYEFEGNDFEFGLFEATMEDDEWVAGATPIQKAYNDINGLIKFSPIEFGEDDVDVDHYYIIKELGLGPDNNTEDVDFDNDFIKVLVTIELNDDNEVVATAYFVGEKESFTNTYEEEETGSIPVSKTVVTPNGIALTSDQTFLVALFDEDGKMYDKAPLPLTVKAGTTFTATGTFTELDLTKVYNVFEVYEADGKYYKIETENGKVKPAGIVPWESIAYENNLNIDVADFDADDNMAPTVTITNTYPGEEDPLLGAITVVKKVTVNNKPFASNVTFHVGLYSDSELTKLIDEKDLTKENLYTVAFEELDAGTYYVAETNGDGKALTKEEAKDLGFEITVDGSDENLATVELIGDDVTVELVNNFKKEEFPLTGDNSNMNLWIFLAMLGVAGAIAPFAFRKKEEAND